jgi:hypothetical protein
MKSLATFCLQQHVESRSVYSAGLTMRAPPDTPSKSTIRSAHQNARWKATRANGTAHPFGK